MRVYMMKIIGRPLDSLDRIETDESGMAIGYGKPGWKPKGWDEHVKRCAEQGYEWALSVAANGGGFFWPSETRKYFSRSAAQAKLDIVKMWGGDAVLLEAEVSEFRPVVEMNAERKHARDLVRVQKLRAQADAIESRADLNLTKSYLKAN